MIFLHDAVLFCFCRCVVAFDRSFRLNLNDDAMATEKLAEGIASFSQAIVKVEKIITDKIRAAAAATSA